MAFFPDVDILDSAPFTRKELRKALRYRRRSLSPRQQRQAARQLCRRFHQHPVLKKSQHIAAYWPSDGEIDPRPLLQELRRQGKKIYLPKLHPYREGHLWFLPWRKNARLAPNRFGIPEPQLGSVPCRPARHLDTILLPLVGFDHKGERLGMGGGFYDRSFAFKSRFRIQKPQLLGLAHTCQQVSSLDSASWDIPLLGVLTERGYI